MRTSGTPQRTPDPRLRTAKAILLDKILLERTGEGLLDFIVRLRSVGLGWRKIADLLAESTGQPVTHQSVINWHRQAEDAKEAAA